MAKFLFIFLPYASVAIFFGGVVYRFLKWGKTPVPLRIVTTPAPKTRGGVIIRLAGDLLWFPSLFKADKVLWAGGLLFHALLWLVLLSHLRFFFYPVPAWVAVLQTAGLYAGYLIPLPLALLLARRLTQERILYISILADFFALFLLLILTVSGVLMELFFRTYVVDVKALVLGLVHFQPVIPEVHWLFGLHFLAVMVLLIYFPFSKLMHAGGFFLSPARNQRANFSERFVNPWDVAVSYNSLNLSTPEKYRETLAGAKEGAKS